MPHGIEKGWYVEADNMTTNPKLATWESLNSDWEHPFSPLKGLYYMHASQLDWNSWIVEFCHVLVT